MLKCNNLITRPKVTHVITGLNVGGAERALHSLLTGGLQDAFDNHVISLMNEGHYGPLLQEAGIPITYLNMSPGRPTLDAVRRLKRAIHATSPNVIQGWMYHGNLAASLARRLCGSGAALSWNIRLSLEAGRSLKASTRCVIGVGEWLSHGPDAIIYNAARSKAQHEERGYARMHSVTIPNGFDTKRWQPDSNARARLCVELGVADDAFLIGFVGRGHAQKDLPNLFSAFRAAAVSYPDAYLVCVGRDLEGFASEYKDLNQVRFLGQRSDIEHIMPAFNLLCLSSSFEGFPNVIGEAMACGVPCVTTDVGDAAAIVADTGWTAPPRDSAALANSLIEALALPPPARRARGLAARTRIERHYSLKSVVGQYMALYARLAEAR